MADTTDVTIEIDFNEVNIKFDGKIFAGSPEFSEQVLADLRNMQRSSSPDEYGRQLFASAFRDRAAIGVGILQDKLNEQSRSNFRFILDIDPAAEALHQLWWECLVDPNDPARIFSTSSTPFVRNLRSQINRPLIAREKLKIMVVIANPVNLSEAPPGGWGLPEIHVEQERQVIEQVLGQFSDRIEYIKFLPDKDSNERASLNKINQHLRGGKYHILHIIAHGGITKNKGYLLLERDDNGKVAPVEDAAIALSVRDREDLRLVILASCYSANQTTAGVFTGLAPKLYQAGVPAVIAMQDLINQATARRFSQRFYEALLHSDPEVSGKVDTAMNQARFDMRIDDIGSDEVEQDAWGWAIPVLYLHGDGRLYDLARPASSGLTQDKSSHDLRLNVSARTAVTTNFPSAAISPGARPGFSIRQGISQDLITQINAPPVMQNSLASPFISGKQVGLVSAAQKGASFSKGPD